MVVYAEDEDVFVSGWPQILPVTLAWRTCNSALMSKYLMDVLPQSGILAPSE